MECAFSKGLVEVAFVIWTQSLFEIGQETIFAPTLFGFVRALLKEPIGSTIAVSNPEQIPGCERIKDERSKMEFVGFITIDVSVVDKLLRFSEEFVYFAVKT